MPALGPLLPPWSVASLAATSSTEPSKSLTPAGGSTGSSPRIPLLREFIAARHEDNIARFKAADARVGEIAKQIVRARLGGDVPSPTTFGTDPEWGTLARELVKKARHMPLRKLFAQIPTALTRLTPCVMMSPLSIAQYLPADAQPFDVVLFDEASQIPVWDAIGVIARGKQVVVVGDPQQLPPTSLRRARCRRRRGRHRRRPIRRAFSTSASPPNIPHAPARLALPQPAREPDRLLQPRLLRRPAGHVPLTGHRGPGRALRPRPGRRLRARHRPDEPRGGRAVTADVVRRLKRAGLRRRPPLARHCHLQCRAAAADREPARPGAPQASRARAASSTRRAGTSRSSSRTSRTCRATSGT